MREHDKETVVVIGAGLAGLTAAATAARARRPVVVVEAHTAGGRARTDELSGYRFNQGPHALGRGGEAWRILHDLGVPTVDVVAEVVSIFVQGRKAAPPNAQILRNEQSGRRALGVVAGCD